MDLSAQVDIEWLFIALIGRNSVEYTAQPMRNEQLLPTNESHLSSIAAIYSGSTSIFITKMDAKSI